MTSPLVIHEVLPTELLGAIFEEHARLEWRAPAIDGQVCRFWRQIVLDTPRVWTYLEIENDKRPDVSSLSLWLSRSCTAPLHIHVNKNFTPDKHINKRTFYDILGDHHKRIAFLQMRLGRPSFFQGRDFPCLRLLAVKDWYSIYLPSTVPWGPMPELRSLRIGAVNKSAVTLDALASLTELSLYETNFISLPQYPQSITRLMLDDVSIKVPISGLVTFPSLTYLSLYDVGSFKPHINAPCLIVYHEGGDTVDESFYAPQPSLVEYGVYGLITSDLCPERWHLSFPNILRLSIRADQRMLLSFLGSFTDQPLLLPALQTISAGHLNRTIEIPEVTQEAMGGLVRVRSEAGGTRIVPCFETGAPFQIPIYFGSVSSLSNLVLCLADTHTRNRMFLTESCLVQSPHLLTFTSYTNGDM